MDADEQREFVITDRDDHFLAVIVAVSLFVRHLDNDVRILIQNFFFLVRHIFFLISLLGLRRRASLDYPNIPAR